MGCLSELDVVILAGGLGSRLAPVIDKTPKVLAPVQEKPFVQHLIDQVHSFGARRIVFALGHMALAVQTYLAKATPPALDVVTVVEPRPLGTGGALRFALPHIASETVLVMNGDSFVQADFCRFLAFHRSRPARVSMVVTRVPDAARYGLVDTDAQGRVTAYQEKVEAAGAAGDINAGVYCFEAEAIRAIPTGRPVSLEREVFPPLCGRGWYAMRGEFSFIDIGTRESYRMADTFFCGARAS